MTTTTNKYRAPALDKGLDILEVLARTTEPLTMAEIAAAIGYSKGEIFRMLQVLESRQYVARATESGYLLTNRLFLLGMERPPVKSLVDAALPVMHRFAEEAGQPCHLVVASNEQMVVIARIDPPGDIGFVVRVGHRLPLCQSTSGRVLFAFQDEGVRQRWLDTLVASGSLKRRKAFLADAQAIREQGHACMPSSDVDGVIDLSAPIMQHEHAVGALTVPFVAVKNGKNSEQKVLKYLRSAAADISRDLIR